MGPARPRGPRRLARREPADDRRLGRLTAPRTCREVIYDAEHFFDGFKKNPDYALQTLRAAADAGAAWIVLCDTNGGTLARGGRRGRRRGRARRSTCRSASTRHNDGELAVANTLAAVAPGRDAGPGDDQRHRRAVRQRRPRAASIANLALKYRATTCSAPAAWRSSTEVSRYVYETANMNFRPGQPFVGHQRVRPQGRDARPRRPQDRRELRAHRPGPRRQRAAGAGQRALRQVEHRREARRVRPRAAIPTLLARVLDRVQDLENEGYQFEAAEASFVLLVEKLAGPLRAAGSSGSATASASSRAATATPVTEATVKLRVGDSIEHTVSEGDGPVNALDGALRKALEPHFPRLAEMQLVDYKVRVINARAGTAARVRVVIESQDRRRGLGDGRRLRERHRGELAGAGRRVRSQARQGLAVEGQGSRGQPVGSAIPDASRRARRRMVRNSGP